jgi:O-methyltransferase involved in polyketide biosynthesis
MQVVIIAAGYDTRAYRLSKPGVRFYEVDLPHASQHKQDLVRKLLPASKVRILQAQHSSLPGPLGKCPGPPN